MYRKLVKVFFQSKKVLSMCKIPWENWRSTSLVESCGPCGTLDLTISFQTGSWGLGALNP